MAKQRKLFCEYGPICYKISLIKEAIKKDLRDFKAGKFAKKKQKENLQYIWKSDEQKAIFESQDLDIVFLYVGIKFNKFVVFFDGIAYNYSKKVRKLEG